MRNTFKNFVRAIVILTALLYLPIVGEAQPKAVDLGLSVKWASYNLGAISPSDYGEYYAWGETWTKDYYDWDSYSFCGGDKYSMKKYNVERGFGRVDNKTRLDLSDDVARKEWGGRWRIPTNAEWEELRNNCTWTWTSQAGNYGYKVTSRNNGNSIFLPVAGGIFLNIKAQGEGTYGRYWSSSLDTDYPYRAWSTYFRKGKISSCGDSRYLGFSVRPVLDSWW